MCVHQIINFTLKYIELYTHIWLFSVVNSPSKPHTATIFCCLFIPYLLFSALIFGTCAFGRRSEFYENKQFEWLEKNNENHDSCIKNFISKLNYAELLDKVYKFKFIIYRYCLDWEVHKPYKKILCSKRNFKRKMKWIFMLVFLSHSSNSITNGTIHQWILQSKLTAHRAS